MLPNSYGPVEKILPLLMTYTACKTTDLQLTNDLFPSTGMNIASSAAILRVPTLLPPVTPAAWLMTSNRDTSGPAPFPQV